MAVQFGNTMLHDMFYSEHDLASGRASADCGPHSSRAKNARRPVSRVLSAPCGAVMAIPLGRPLPDASRDLPGRRRGNAPADGCRRRAAPIWSCSRWGLPCRRRCRRRGALLPHPFTLARRRPEALRRWRFAFCGTFPGVAPAGRYPAPCFRGARTFLPPLAERRRAAIRPSGAASGRRWPGPRQPGSARATATAISEASTPCAADPARRRCGAAGNGAGRPRAPRRSAAVDDAGDADVVAEAGEVRLHLAPWRRRVRRAGIGNRRRPARGRCPARRQPPPVEQLAGIDLARRRHVGMAEHAMGAGWDGAPGSPRASSISACHLRFGKGPIAELMAGIDQLDADRAALMSRAPAQELTPACQARRSSGTRRIDRAVLVDQ